MSFLSPEPREGRLDKITRDIEEPSEDLHSCRKQQAAIRLRIFHQPGAPGVQVDVSGHRVQRLAFASTPFVEPAAEALLDLFHVDRQVAEALLDGFEPGQSQRFHAQSAELLQLLPQQTDEFLAVKRAQVLEEPLLTALAREALEPDLAPRHLHQRVEGVAHDAVGDEPYAGELRHFPEQAMQGLLFDIIRRRPPDQDHAAG